jgi:uncharacterized protein YraI
MVRTALIRAAYIFVVGTALALLVLSAPPAFAQATGNDDSYTTPLNTALNIPAPGVLSNDTGTAPLTASAPTAPANGVVTTFNADGSFIYTPNAGFAGTDTFNYTVTDGVTPDTATVTIVVSPPTATADNYNTPLNTPLNIAAPGVLANDSAGAGSSATLTAQLVTNVSASSGLLVFNANGSFTFTPLAGFTGNATFTYRAQRSGDNAFSNIVTVTITVNAPTATPALTAANDTYFVSANTVFSVSAPGVLVNDTASAGTLTALLTSPASSGSVVLNADGSFTYTPITGFTGLATFQYVAAQGVAQSNVATVSINVGGAFVTPTGTITGTPGVGGTPGVQPTLIPLFIPGPTALPQPVPNAGQSGALPISDVTVLVNRDAVNVRLIPAIGAEVIGFVNAGYTAQVKARTADGQWVKVEFSGEEGWIGVPVLTILSGNLDNVPVEDPRTIPYGGFGSPRAGLTSRTSNIAGILRDSGVRVRSGPSRAYVVLANAPRGTTFSILGRTFNNGWFQVNFNGVLGWVIAREVELQNANFTDAPIDGIVADALPIGEGTNSNYIGTLRLLLDRLNIAQASLDVARQRWTDAALTGQLACGNYPPSPTDYALANPLAAAFYDTLVPVVTDFNSAMANLRVPIDLLIDACTDFGGRVGQPQIQIALQAIAAADGLFAVVRGRLSQLIPPDRELGPEDCPFTFANQTAILPRLRQAQLAVVQLTARDFVFGFCVDATAGQQLRIEALAFTGNAQPVVSISPYDNPTNFIGVGRAGGANQLITVAPVTIDRTAVYLIVLSDLGAGLEDPLNAQVALFVTDITNAAGGFLAPGLSIDPLTGQLIANPNPSLNLPTADPNFLLTPGALGGLGTPQPTIELGN